jgi:hypothetical protein
MSGEGGCLVGGSEEHLRKLITASATSPRRRRGTSWVRAVAAISGAAAEPPTMSPDQLTFFACRT